LTTAKIWSWDPEGLNAKKDWLTDWPTDRPTDRLTDWLTDWPTDWLTDQLTDSDLIMEMRSAYKMLLGKAEWKISLQRRKGRQGDNINMDHKYAGCGLWRGLKWLWIRYKDWRTC
jgi:hypothetical protein